MPMITDSVAGGVIYLRLGWSVTAWDDGGISVTGITDGREAEVISQL
jgi:hypothetical protein